jgi:hypothetical protein
MMFHFSSAQAYGEIDLSEVVAWKVGGAPAGFVDYDVYLRGGGVVELAPESFAQFEAAFAEFRKKAGRS